MKVLSSNDIVQLLREEYVNHLNAKLQEIRTFNSQGQMVIGKDLKVKHKPSGFIYTVKGVTGEPGNAKIVLRSPEEPRVDPNAETSVIDGGKLQKQTMDASTAKPMPFSDKPLKGDVIEDKKPKKNNKEEKEDKKDYGVKAYPKEKPAPKSDSGDTMFVIDQKEFEKHYEEA